MYLQSDWKAVCILIWIYSVFKEALILGSVDLRSTLNFIANELLLPICTGEASVHGLKGHCFKRIQTIFLNQRCFTYIPM